MSALLHLAVKDLRLLARDKFGLFWILAFPLMYAGFFGMIFGDSDGGGRGRITLVLVDEDQSPRSAALVGRLAEHESVDVARGEEPERAVTLVPLEEARDLVRRGKRAAYLRIPSGYGENPFALFGGGDDAPRLELGLDPARTAEAGFLQGVLMETVFSGLSDVITDKDAVLEQIELGEEEIRDAQDVTPAQRLVFGTFFDSLKLFIADVDMEALEEGTGGIGGMDGLIEVVKVERDASKRPRSSFEITFPQSMVWGLMGVALGFAITLVRERTRGTLLRLRMAPITRAQLLAGKSLACFAMCMITMAFLLAFGSLFLNVRVVSPALLLVAMAATSVCFTGVMMTASVLGKTEEAVAGAAWGSMMPFAMIGGGMIPLIAMPPWLIEASNFSPFKWAIYSMEGAIWRGFSPAEMVVPCAVLVAIGLGFFVLGYAIFRRIDA